MWVPYFIAITGARLQLYQIEMVYNLFMKILCRTKKYEFVIRKRIMLELEFPYKPETLGV